MNTTINELKQLAKEYGGKFHGPNIEHLSISEVNYYKLMEAYHTQALSLQKNTIDKNIYTLELHENINISSQISVMRVPGGWIYTTFRYTNDNKAHSHETFVPFDIEFMDLS